MEPTKEKMIAVLNQGKVKLWNRWRRLSGSVYVDLREASLQYSDLRYADLRKASLQYADLQNADLRYADLQEASLQEADLQNANLREANLQEANLQNADIREADIDFSCLPLWCGGLKIKLSDNVVAQLLYHALSQDNDNKEYHRLRNECANFVNSNFHRIGEVEKI